jgi:NADH:ubiquinone oxidoreductase subunit 5 (subunit L)/multisubunit Na+/H+ antiporter MnhA subunit
MFSLVFMGDESEYLKLQRVHESPMIMLIPAAILAGFCIYWGVGEPVVANFLGVTLFGGDALGIIYEAFFNIETPIFLALLLPIGIIAYYSYFKRYNGIRNIAAGRNPLSAMLKHAFFFDYTYDIFAKGITGFSITLTRVENALFARLPDDGAAKISRAAQPGHAITLKKGFSGSYRNYIAAAVLGFILIVVLIILTFGIGLEEHKNVVTNLTIRISLTFDKYPVCVLDWKEIHQSRSHLCCRHRLGLYILSAFYHSTNP